MSKLIGLTFLALLIGTSVVAWFQVDGTGDACGSPGSIGRVLTRQSAL